MVDDAFAKFQQQFELFFNQDRAELAAVRTILQTLLVSLAASNPRGADMLAVLKQAALKKFEKPSPSEATNQDQKRMRELTRGEVEAFFEGFDLTRLEDEPKSSGPH
jgi:hypothetical protein